MKKSQANIKTNLIFGVCFIFLTGIFFIYFVSAGQDDFTKENDKVYREDSHIYLSAYPHTISSSQWVYFNLTTKQTEGNTDVLLGFNNKLVKPIKAEIYNPHYNNWTTEHSHFFYNVMANEITLEKCEYGNSYNKFKEKITYEICSEWSETEMDKCLKYSKTSSIICYDSKKEDHNNWTINWKTKHSKLILWDNFPQEFNILKKDFKNMNIWYEVNNIKFTQNEPTQIRMYIDMPIGFNVIEGEYYLALKESKYTFDNAILIEKLHYLDPWFNSSWSYRKNITIDHLKVNGTQTNFPVLINLTDTDLRDDAQNDGDDIVFTNSTGTKLDYEIEYFNGTDGRLVAWVRVPSLSGDTNTTIQMYYGNADAVNQENMEGVWDDNFVMVQHMQETPTASINDSTSNNNDGTTYNMDSADQVAGQIDGSLEFNGTNGYIDTPLNTAFNNFSVVVWFKDTPGGDMYERLVDKSYSGGFWLGRYGNAANFWGGGIKDTSYPYGRFITLTDGEWHQIAFIREGTTHTIYGNGGNVSTSGSVTGDALDNTVVRIGGKVSDNNFGGLIDEVRISNIARSLEWIKTEYNNQYSPSTFYSIGSEETTGADTTKPTYSNNAHNTTIAGQSIKFSIQYNDNTALHPDGQYIFSTNNTGTWVNESLVNWTATPNWANITKTLNSTVGLCIGYRWYADDNTGNINDTEIFSLTTTGADTCSCPGLATNWEIDLSDNCQITSNCNLSTGNITFINTGSVLFNATLTAYKISWKDSVSVIEKYNLGNNFRGWVG